jgi:AraC-like DNA-binding protein
MDALSEVLRVVRLTGGVFLDARFTAPWSVITNVQPDKLRLAMGSGVQIIAFHYVVSGRLIAHVPGQPALEVGAGGLVLFPRNDLHVLASAADLTPRPAAELRMDSTGEGLWKVSEGGGGEETRVVCGFLGSDAGFNPAVAALPVQLAMDLGSTPGGSWMAESFAFATHNLSSGAVGAATIVAKLSELMFVETVRRYIETLPPGETGWLAGLRDPAIGQALALMHAQPQRACSAEELARRAGLSRSTFAERFTTLIGRPPMRYLAAWRMQLAAQALRDTGKSIAQIAYEVGYESEAAFTRAFRRELGQPPAAWRRQAIAA